MPSMRPDIIRRSAVSTRQAADQAFFLQTAPHELPGRIPESITRSIAGFNGPESGLSKVARVAFVVKSQDPGRVIIEFHSGALATDYQLLEEVSVYRARWIWAEFMRHGMIPKHVKA
jgi:hypothetical protein